ncbi:hypothetical protein [Actinoplanes flavus]|uniref:DUF222 domain-containing protein n=1 Tax=Actinoplanes flavus TaxID=2820290 RepID=A0ABS3V012_9ACTN|nr:hypothetical protein [Actinoplanes flavus]MBO3744159.1 hypothetical protein [Actinoplanes flavus]
MRQLGVAPEPVDQHGLTVSRLAAAIRRAVDDPVMVAAARRLGERVRTENGVTVAVDVLEQAALDPRYTRVLGEIGRCRDGPGTIGSDRVCREAWSAM